MKKLFKYILVFISCACANAQEQFTNFGNFQTFTGAQITFFGNFKNDGTITDNAQGIAFKGSASQSISGSSVTTISNLTIEADATGIIMYQNLIISNSLTLTSGPLYLNSKTLTLNNSSTTALSRTGGYLLSESTDNSSKVIWNIGTTAGAHIIPFGTAGGVNIPFSVAVTAGNIGNVSVSTYPTNAANLPYPTSPVAITNMNTKGGDNSANVVDRFWQIDKDGPSGTATLVFAASAAEVGSITNLQAQRWNSVNSRWDTPITGQISTATGTTVTGVTTFSPWTLSGNNSPLPIELTDFTASLVKTQVELNWQTSSELNNDFFTVQRSFDDVNFIDIGKVDGAGTSRTIKDYNFIDAKPIIGRSYYRLRQTDFDGTYQFSKVRTIVFDNISRLKITAYPNPAQSNQFSINFHNPGDSPLTIALYDGLGQIVFSQVLDAAIHTFEVNLPSNTPAGMYILKASNNTSITEETVVLE